MSKWSRGPYRRIVIGFIVVAPFALAGFLFGVSAAEEHDSFCIACHTAPEETYFERANANSAVDLASAHYVGEEIVFRCIDCHRGESDLSDRATTLALGARDTLIWLTGRADEAIEKAHSDAPELANRACLRCHTEPVLVEGFNNHFHNKLRAAYEWRVKGGEAGLVSAEFGGAVACIDCHRAHVQNEVTRDQFYLDIEGVVYPACEGCHRDMGRGPLELN